MFWVDSGIITQIGVDASCQPLSIESFYTPHRELSLFFTITTSICVDPK
jgi:hypothetical protein